jgi:hypothetical protein
MGEKIRKTDAIDHTIHSDELLARRLQSEEDSELAQKLTLEAADAQFARELQDRREASAPRERDLSIMRSTQQQGMTCGFWSVFNAKAIDSLLSRNEEISGPAVQRESRRFLDYITTVRPLWTEQVAATAARLGVAIILLGIYPEHGVLPLIADLAVDESALSSLEGRPLGGRDHIRLMAQHVDRAMEQLTGPFRAALRVPGRSAALHFVCNVGSNSGGHWILVSVIRLPPNPPTMLLLDSSNAMTVTRRMRMCVAFIRKHLPVFDDSADDEEATKAAIAAGAALVVDAPVDKAAAADE